MKLNPFRTCLAVSAAVLLALAAVLPARADYSNTVMSLSPIGYWRLNDTTPVPRDSAINSGSLGTAADGLYVGTITHPTTPGALSGSPDGAVTLSGGSGYMSVPFSPSLNTPSFTVEAWLNPADIDGTIAAPNHCAISCGDFASPRAGWLIYQSGEGWNLRMYNRNGTATSLSISGGDAPSAGEWYHVAVAFDGTTARLYINGAEVASGNPTSYVPGSAGSLTVARRADNSFGWNGVADEVAFYTNVLSASVIAAHYSAATTNGVGYATQILANNPVAYYRLNEPTFTFVAPPAANNGSWAAGGNGAYYPGSAPLAPGVPYEGFGANNTGCRFAGIAGLKDGAVGDPATPGSCIKIPAQSGIVEEMTITCWIKRDGDQVYWRGLVTQRDADPSGTGQGGNGTGITLGGNNASANQGQGAELRMLWDKNDVYWQYDPQLYTPNQQWAFCAVVFSLTNRTVYLNTRQASQTVEAAGTTMPQTPHDLSVNPIFIGYDARGPYIGGGENSAFQGTMDEVAIFNKALTTNEIMQIYAAAEVPPIILVQPVAPPPPVYDGMNLSLSVVADLTATLTPLGYQWTKDGFPIPGQTGTNYTVNSLAVNDSGSYAVVITNAAGATTSSVVALSVQVGPPVIAQQPQSITRYESAKATFSVVAWGSAPMSYQWTNNAGVIPGATNASYTINGVLAADAGNYGVRASNRFGTTNSATASLTVLPVTNYTTAAMAGNPIAYYRLNETSGTTAADFAGGLPGTLTGPIVTGDTGPQPPTWTGLESGNTAFQFDGTGTRVQLPSFNLQTNQMTIVAWINPNGSQISETGILVSRSSALAGFILNYNGSDALSYVWEGTASFSEFKSGLVPVWGQWNFAAMVIDPTKGTVYLDTGDGTGLQSASFVPPEGNKTVIWDIPYIGTDLNYSRYFNGSIDEVVVYDRALSPAEIANLDLLGSAGRVAPRITQQPASQTVYAGQSADFSVGALGALPLGYQWQHAGTNLPGATSPTLAIPSAYYTDAGSYRAVITNSMGSSNSVTATLMVLLPPELTLFANATNDLVLHLKFDGDYLDSSGRGNDGTKVGSPSFVAGKIGGGALHYSTIVSGGAVTEANYVTLNTPADLKFTNDVNFSVAFWIKFTGLPGDLPYLVNNDFSYGGVGLTLASSYNEGAWSWYINDAAAAPWAGIGMYAPMQNTLNDGVWHHLVYSFDRAGYATVYRDGVMENQTSIATGAGWNLDTGMAFDIGQAGGSYAEAAAFEMDDMGVWRRALSPTEAESIYIVGQNYGRTFDQYGPVMLSIQPSGAGFDLIWQAGTLLECDTVNGTYVPVSGASAPYYHVTPSAARKFYRVRL